MKMIIFPLLALLAGAAFAAKEYKVVGYFPNSGKQVEAPWTYVPENVDPSLLTHILFAFASISNTNPSITLSPSASEDAKKVVELKKVNPNLKVLLSLGAKWTNSAETSARYAKLIVPSVPDRPAFIQQTVALLEQYNFDGLDFESLYPSDKKEFVAFLKELSKIFKSKNLLLSASVLADKKTIDSLYDVPAFNKHFNFLSVITYDYNARTGPTGLNAPLDKAKDTINYYKSKGASPDKLVLGIAFYGTSSTLKNPIQNGIGAPVKGPGKAGYYTKDPGFLAYFEICSESGWIKKNVSNIGVYTYKGDQWVSYDDTDTVEAKTKYVKSEKFGGVMVWDLSQDDFLGKYSKIKYPLLQAVNNGLKQAAGSPAAGHVFF